jgi:YegS/Rv2252/BmrU family lipid kinase
MDPLQSQHQPRADAANGPGRRALFLFNDKAGGGGKSLAPALEAFARGGVGIYSLTLGDPDILERARERKAEGCDHVVVCGGDGTLHRTAPLLLQLGLPVGILPFGTANDLARTLAIPLDIPAAAGVILAGKRAPVDLGTVNGIPFFNVASIGMSVKLAEELTGGLKRRFGVFGYAIAAARAAYRSRPFTAIIAGGGEVERVRTLQVAVGNGCYYGGGMAVHEDACIRDGKLHLYSLELDSVWHFLPMLRDFRRGTHGRHVAVRTLVGDKFEVATRRPRPVNADGEIVTTTPADFGMLPEALTLFVP